MGIFFDSVRWITVISTWPKVDNCRAASVSERSKANDRVPFEILLYIIYGTCHKKLYKIRRNPQKFCADSAKLLCSYLRNCSITSAESISHFYGMIHHCSRNDTLLFAEWYFAVRGFVLTKLTSSFFMECLYILYTNMAHKLRTGSK